MQDLALDASLCKCLRFQQRILKDSSFSNHHTDKFILYAVILLRSLFSANCDFFIYFFHLFEKLDDVCQTFSQHSVLSCLILKTYLLSCEIVPGKPKCCNYTRKTPRLLNACKCIHFFFHLVLFLHCLQLIRQISCPELNVA